MMIELTEKQRGKFARWDCGLLVLLLVLMVCLGIAPADRTVWMVESVWSVGLLAVLAVTRKWFKFSNAAFFAVMTTVAMVGVWEIVEWLYAAIDGGEVGAAFLGSQGDVWDAQKDILCDTLGALYAAALYCAMRKDRQEERL